MLLVVLMIASGGFMAGTKAGFIYNTWPYMGADWAPEALWAMTPWWRNVFENPVTVQFIHRWLAVLVFVNVLLFVFAVRRSSDSVAISRTASLAGGLIFLQLILGVATLVYSVPTWLGVSHQGGALLVLGAIVVIWAGHLRPLGAEPHGGVG